LLRRSAFARAIAGSVQAAGFEVSVDDAIVALEGGDPLETHPWDWAALGGCRSAMTYVLHLATDPHFEYSTALVRALHFMISHHDLGRNPGRWRPGPGLIRDEWGGGSERVVYEAPSPELVPELVAELVESILPENATEHDPIVVAAAAHLNLALIHPFAEANGRMARCLQALVLARASALPPQFSSIEEYIALNAQAYREVLADVGGGRWQPGREARPWLRFCLGAHLWQVNNLIRRARETELLWELVEEEMGARGLPTRLTAALVDAASGLVVRNATYRPIADVSDQVASRDLKLAVDARLLIARGEKRRRFYVASTGLEAMRERVQETHTNSEGFYDRAY
jgi:Fic family protein